MFITLQALYNHVGGEKEGRGRREDGRGGEREGKERGGGGGGGMEEGEGDGRWRQGRRVLDGVQKFPCLEVATLSKPPPQESHVRRVIARA